MPSLLLCFSELSQQCTLLWKTFLLKGASEMKVLTEYPSFPKLRRYFKSYKELAVLIDRSTSYVNNCLNGRRSFTRPEKFLIASVMGMTVEDVFGPVPEVEVCTA